MSRPDRRIELEIAPGERQDYTEMVMILDASGSMADVRHEHEGGMNTMVEQQKELPGNVRFTLIEFNSVNPCNVRYSGVPVVNVEPIRFFPTGGTPLYAGICQAIEHVKTRLAGINDQPDEKVLVIITDGKPEGSQFGYTSGQARAAIQEAEAAGWRTIFLGANIDAFGEASDIGILSQANVANFNNDSFGIRNAYRATSSNVLRARSLTQHCASRDDVSASYAFSAEQRAAMTSDPDPNAVAMSRSNDPNWQAPGVPSQP